MRNAFAAEMTELVQSDERIVLLSGDIGNRLFNKYKEVAPTRFYNCGVAEANMTGVAAGLAMCGLRPITYTITPFNTLRCYEQIKIDVCYHNVPVIIVGTGSGLSYANLGPTHHSCDDIAAMRALPNMTVLAPCDAPEVHACLRLALSIDGPVYIRIGKKNEPVIHDEIPKLSVEQPTVFKDGSDACIINTGTTIRPALDAADLLAEKGVSATVMNMHTVKPLNGDVLTDVFANHRVVATVEEHSIIGGLGSAVSEWLADTNTSTAGFIRFASTDEFLCECGNQGKVRERLGLTAENIGAQIHKRLG